MIASIAHQFFRLQDTLVDTFLLSMQSAVHTAHRDHKEKCYEQRELRSKSLKSVVSYLDASLNFREAIGQITNDPELNDAEKVARIRGLLSESMHQHETVATLKKECEFRQGGGDYYDILEERSVKMQNRATPILKALTFNSKLTTVSLVQAIDHFKERDGALDSNAPMDLLSAEERAAVCSNGKLKQYVSLSEVLSTVDRHSAFLDEFQHWQQRHNRSKPAKKTFIAAVSAIGCDIGMGKILKISSEIDPSEWENTVNWFFYPEGLQAVNDQLLHFMDGLELPNIYRKSQDSLHTSSDGQKFEVRAESLNANYSFKYFGKGKGVSVYSFIDERHLLFHSTVISSAERESAYVIDGLMHNDVVKSDIHSTDTHGYSEAIFGAIHLLGFFLRPSHQEF